MSCLFVLILSPLILGIASIGLAAAYYSAGNGLSFLELFVSCSVFPADDSSLQLLSGLTTAV